MPFRPLKPEEKKSWIKESCKCPEHNPPGMIVLKPGLHIWVCPHCGQEQPVFVRDRSSLQIPLSIKEEKNLECKSDHRYYGYDSTVKETMKSEGLIKNKETTGYRIYN